MTCKNPGSELGDDVFQLSIVAIDPKWSTMVVPTLEDRLLSAVYSLNLINSYGQVLGSGIPS